VASLMSHGRFTEAAFALPFCERVLDAAAGLIAHSRYVLDRVAALRPDLPSAHVPIGVARAPPGPTRRCADPGLVRAYQPLQASRGGVPRAARPARELRQPALPASRERFAQLRRACGRRPRWARTCGDNHWPC